MQYSNVNTKEREDFIQREIHFAWHVANGTLKFSDSFAFADFIYDHVRTVYKDIEFNNQPIMLFGVCTTHQFLNLCDDCNAVKKYDLMNAYTAAWRRHYSELAQARI